MPLITDTESVSSLSSPKKSEIIEKKEGEVKQSFVNKNSILSTRYKDMFDSLMQYSDGTPFVTEFYNGIDAQVDIVSGDTTLLTTKHNVHKQAHLIHNFEMRLEGGLQYDYDEESTITSVQGTALLYPGFPVNIGDVFLYTLLDGSIGIFIINNAPPLSIERYSYRRVDFNLIKIAEQDDLDNLNASITDEFYFDKQKYFTNDFSVLHAEDYLLLKDISKYETLMIKRYFDMFFVRPYNTILLGDDNPYDPLLIEYMNKIVSIKDVQTKPYQWFGSISEYYENTIWAIFTDGIGNDPKMLKKKQILLERQSPPWVAIEAGLLGRNYILPLYEGQPKPHTDVIIETYTDDTYIFSNHFYNDTLGELAPDDEEYDPFEVLVSETIKNRKVPDPVTFVTEYLEQVDTLTKEQAYYRIPIYIYLIRVIKHNIQ